MAKSARNFTKLNLILSFLVCLIVAFSFSNAHAADHSSDDFRLTYDISGSLGNYGDRGYQEISLGLNAHFAEWFVWRNAGFARFTEGTDNIYGLDTTARFVLNLGDSKLGLVAFAGPGYRFATSAGSSQADSAPFAEAGVIAKLAGLSIGGGFKSVFNSLVRTGSPDDRQFFLILAGGGAL
ncbi:hypothetical protein BH10BDE1_BH10BDE1_28700 [soil metagenome]